MIVYDTALGRFLTPGRHEAWMHVRVGTNDHNTVYSCLDENEYQLPPLTGVAWDIGAHIGAVSVALALDNPDLRVIAVEPVPDNLELLLRNVLQNKVDDRVTIIPGAVGKGKVNVAYGYTGSEHALHHAFIGNLTLLDPIDGTKRVTYPGLTVRSLIRAYGTPSFVKIDTEGAEWTFLRDCKLPLIVGEWHPNGGPIGEFIALLPHHEVTFTGPQEGPGGFRAVRK